MGNGRSEGILVESSSRRVTFFLLLTLLFSTAGGCFQNAPAPSAERAVGFLRSLAQDESSEVRRTAAESLGKIGDPASVNSILSLRDDPVPIVRAAAAQALGRVGSASNDEVVAALARLLDDPVEEVRRTAAVAIGEIEPKTTQLGPVLNLAKGTRNVRVRETAIRAIAQLDVSRWEDDLITMLRDADPDVRQATVAALGPSGGSEVLSALRQRLMEDTAPSVRAEAAYQIGKRTGMDVRTALERAAVSDRDESVRRWAESELRSLRGND